MPRKSTVFLVLAAFALAPLGGVYCAWSCAGDEAVEDAQTAAVSHQHQAGSDLAPALGTDDACGASEVQPAVPARRIPPAPVATSGVVARMSHEGAVVPVDVAPAITPRCGAPPGPHLSRSLRI